MEALKIKAHIGHDGILQLDVPIGVADVDCDVVVTVPIGVADVDCDVVVTVPIKMTDEEWSQFVDRTAGSLADDPIERPPQGEYEQRDPIP